MISASEYLIFTFIIPVARMWLELLALLVLVRIARYMNNRRSNA